MEKTMGLGSVGEPVRKCNFGKSRLTKASDQTKLSVSALSIVSMSVEKWLRNSYLLKVATPLNVPFYEIKSCGVIPSFYIYIRQNRDFCSLKQVFFQKKACFLLWAKLSYSGRAGGSPPLSSSPLGYAPCSSSIKEINRLIRNIKHLLLRRTMVDRNTWLE